LGIDQLPSGRTKARFPADVISSGAVPVMAPHRSIPGRPRRAASSISASLASPYRDGPIMSLTLFVDDNLPDP